MKLNLSSMLPGLSVWALAVIALILPPSAGAFPPAPHHLIYGTVRDEYGTPLITSVAQIMLQTPTGAHLQANVVFGLGLGMNYELEVPMDAGLTADVYEPNALKVAAPFRLYVVIGQSTNLPIQMSGNLAQLGQPAQSTRIDLTLGVDSNGNGIPDAWEQAFLASLGLNLNLSDLQPNTDYAHDGRTLRQEFLLGNYPFNPGDSFEVKLVNLSTRSAILEFTTMTGRSYSLQGSTDLQQWTPLSFTIPDEGTNAGTHSYYSASDIRTLQLSVLRTEAAGNVQLVLPSAASSRFYRLAQGTGVALSAPPQLSFAHTPTNAIVVSWPAAASGWVLQESTRLAGSTWTAVTTPVQVPAPTAPPRFFRLLLQ